MEVAAIPVNEAQRLEALQELGVLDTLPEEDFDNISQLAAAICQTPILLISLIDKDRQWFKARKGLDATETSRDLSFCAHAINKPSELMVVPDSRKDHRFKDNPLVTGAPHVIFYAGMPLVNSEGHALGSLCVIDHHPRKLSEHQLTSLKALADQVMRLLDLRLLNLRLNKQQLELESKNQELEKFAFVVSHDIKSPLNNMMALTHLLKSGGSNLDDESIQCIDQIHQSAVRLKKLVEGILSYYKNDQVLAETKESISVEEFFAEILMLTRTTDSHITFHGTISTIQANRSALEQILLNLITNGIKYNDKKEVRINVTLEDADAYWSFSVRDNGIGIAPENFETIFSMFRTLGQRDRFNAQGTGIGLASVKKLVEKLGGRINLISSPGEGSEFIFTILK